MSNWINHVKEFARENEISYREALKHAAQTYQKVEKQSKIKNNSSKGNWIEHVKQYANDNGISYREALKQARKTYHK